MRGTEVTGVIPVSLHTELIADSKHGRLTDLDEKYGEMDTFGKSDVSLWVTQACVEKAVREGRIDGLDEDDEVRLNVSGTIEKVGEKERDSSGRFI